MTDIAVSSKAAQDWAGRLTPAPQGEGGFDECWYPVALSTEVAPGAIHRAEFMDGRVIVVRAQTGEVSVLSSYCRHYGADLADGDVAEGCLVRCPFHHWKYNMAGRCVGNAVGDRVPDDSSLFAFPTRERWGLIWAFNGFEPGYDVPSWDEAEDERYFTAVLAAEFRGDPFFAAMNVIDTQHLAAVHHLDVSDVRTVALGKSFHVDMTIAADYAGLPKTVRHAEIFGTNAVVYSKASIGIDQMGAATPFGGGRSRLYIVTAALRSQFDPAVIAEKVAERENISKEAFQQDVPILDHIRFRVDRLTKSDRDVSAFLQFAAKYPRSHASQRFIT